MLHPSKIEISKSALHDNLKFLKSRLNEGVKFSSVVKGNAYGHGIEIFVPIAEDAGVDHFSVFSADEALRVMRASKKKPDIMIMGMIDDESLEWCVRSGIECFVFDRERLRKLLNVAGSTGIKAKIHIELETGMNRTGFEEDELQEVMGILNEHKERYELKGICTHFAGAESLANYVRVTRQKSEFRKLYKSFEKAGFRPEYKHTACSAAAIRYPDTQMDLVRIGILQYGFWPSTETLVQYTADAETQSDPLKRLITWKSKVMSLKNVSKGKYVGYGMSFLAQQDMRLAAVPVGYHHGYSRSLSNLGRVLIGGQRLSVVGLVNMNALLVDITNCDNIQRGDEVVLIGHQGDLEISVAAFGELSNRLNYELLTRIPLDIPRNVVL